MSGTLPKTMTSPGNGEVLTRGTRPFVVTYLDHGVTGDLPGGSPAGEGEGVHVGDNMEVVEEALRPLKVAAGDD